MQYLRPVKTATFSLAQIPHLVATAILSVSFLAGCSSGSRPSTQGGSAVSSDPHLSPMTVTDLNLPPLRCGIRTGCPASVGQLIIYRPNGVSLCTATLIADDTILTAGHCVPWPQLTDEHRFTGGCWFRNLETPAGVRCDTVLRSHQPSANHSTPAKSDFAFIRLISKVAVNRLSAIGDSFEDVGNLARRAQHNTHLVVARTDQRESTLISLPCTNEPDIHLEGREWDPAEVRLLSGCVVVPGDSGAPLFNQLNQIIGVASLHWPKRSAFREQVTVVSRILLPRQYESK